MVIIFGLFVEKERAAAYSRGNQAARLACEEDKKDAITEALMYRDKDEIGVRRISMDDVVRLLDKRGELRD